MFERVRDSFSYFQDCFMKSRRVCKSKGTESGGEYQEREFWWELGQKSRDGARIQKRHLGRRNVLFLFIMRLKMRHKAII